MSSSNDGAGAGLGRGSVVRRYQYVPTQATISSLLHDIAGSDSDDATLINEALMREGLSPADGGGTSMEKVTVLLAGARREAEELRQAARAAGAAEAEQLRQEAQQQGYADGYETGHSEGLAQAEAKTAANIARMHQVVDHLITERQRLLTETESDLVGLALAISQKVIGDLASSCSAVILHLAARAVDVLGNPDDYEVHVSPQDYEMVNLALAESSISRTWKLVADEHVTPGGCTVRHGAAQVDARPQAQLALVHKAFDELSTETRCASAEATSAEATSAEATSAEAPGSGPGDGQCGGAQ
jgi:flagellar assembly protein FliH